MGVLHSKHQKLILQCYPPGKGVDKKPNPLELSYLLYYASTRRVKLQKVIDFLDRKTKSDAGSNKSGNLQVTLAIVSALIEKCADNLNVFAAQVCSILTSILNTGDLALCKSLVATYGVLCSKLDGGLFSGDKDFVDSFSKLTDNLIDGGVSKMATSDPNQKEWKMIALLASRYVFHCLSYNAAVAHRFIDKCVALLALTVHEVSNYDNLLVRLNSNLNVEKDERRISRVITTAAQSQVQEHLEDDALTDQDLNEEALHGLRVLFDTSLSSQISEATIAVVEFTFTNLPKNDPWAITFLEMCASWIPVQLRFVALLTLLSRITVIADKMPEHKSNFPHQVHLGQNLLGLVSSNFNMIGLSISDIIQQLLSLQTKLYLLLADNLAPEQITLLSDIYSQCICNLSSHIYYFDQVLDSIVAILLQIDSVLISSNAAKVGGIYTLVLTLLDTISTIMNLLARKMSSIARNHATLENWEQSFLLLTFVKSYREFTVDATADQISSIQARYLAVFNEFLNTEMVKGDEKSDENISEQAPGVNTSKFLQANYNDYMDSSDNPLSHLLAHCNEYFTEPSFNLFVGRLLLETLQNLLAKTGINFIHNFLPFFSHWQLVEATKSLPECAKDTTGYILLQTALTVLDTQYQETLQVEVGLLELLGCIHADIEDRRIQAVWVDELDGTTNKGTLAAGEPLATNVNKKTLHEFFSQTSLRKWISSLRAALSDLSNGDGLMNGNLAELLSSAGSHSSDDQFQDSSSSPHPNNNANGYGLGSVNDITSIHSGLLNGNFRHNATSADTTQVTSDTLPSIGSNFTYGTNNYKHSLMPRVSDLKQSVEGLLYQDDLFSFHNERVNSTPRSILQRQIHTTDVSSILNGLASEDDHEIVV